MVDGPFVVLGRALPFVGGEGLVGGGSWPALRPGRTPLLVALTVIASKASLTKLATSRIAAFRDRADSVLGNPIGSNVSAGQRSAALRA